MTDALSKTSNAETILAWWRSGLERMAAKSPRLRYPVGKGVALSRMRRFVPARMFDKSFRKQFQLDTPVKSIQRSKRISNGRRHRKHPNLQTQWSRMKSAL